MYILVVMCKYINEHIDKQLYKYISTYENMDAHTNTDKHTNTRTTNHACIVHVRFKVSWQRRAGNGILGGWVCGTNA